jgi:hypothetical protein
MNRVVYYLFFALIVFATCLHVQAQDQELPQFSAKVAVNITADENIKGEVTSYVKRELRSLSDVLVADDKPDWQLDILAIEVATKAGYKSGVVLSVNITKPFENSFWITWLRTVVPDSMSSLIEMLDYNTSDLYEIREHWVRVAPTDGLKTMCEGIVADFDSEILDKQRALYRKILEGSANE